MQFLILMALLADPSSAPDDVVPAADADPSTTTPAPGQSEPVHVDAARTEPAETAPAAPRTPATPAVPGKAEPFAFADWTWLPGNSRTHASPLATEFFTGELRVDTAYHYSFNHPKDDTISGSSEVFRHGELQLTQLGVGGDFHYKNVMARVMTQFGMYSQTTPRNDASPARGQWNLDNAYRYISEAYGGYHIDALHGINIQAGIFMSYIGLWSYYQADNWTYQPSYVSSNTPWFFNGLRAQIFVTDRLKIEPWLVNGWQSYGRFNSAPGGGGQIVYRPTDWLAFVGNQYAGADTLGVKGRKRFHTDDSVMIKAYDNPDTFFTRGAFSLTIDAGCEDGDGNGSAPAVKCSNQYFLGFMAYTRWWFLQDHFAMTFGGGAITNPGRYLVLIPPINGANAYSGTPYFTASPGDKYKAWDTQVTFDYVPIEQLTFRFEFNHRHASVPYFSGPGGVTPDGGNQGSPGSLVDGFTPDLRKTENRLTLALLVKI